MRIVIFGGAFDPWTSAHQEIVQTLSQNYDKVILVPSTIRYYKKNEQMFSFDDRFSAARQNTAAFKNVALSDIEKSAADDWRYIDTLRALIAQHGENNEYFTAIGSDSLQNFTTWYKWEEILSLSKLVVFNRPGHTSNFPQIQYEYLPMENPVSSTQLRAELRKR